MGVSGIDILSKSWSDTDRLHSFKPAAWSSGWRHAPACARGQRSQRAPKQRHLCGLVPRVQAGVEGAPQAGGLRQRDAQQAGARLLGHRRLVLWAAGPGATRQQARLHHLLQPGRAVRCAGMSCEAGRAAGQEPSKRPQAESATACLPPQGSRQRPERGAIAPARARPHNRAPLTRSS